MAAFVLAVCARAAEKDLIPCYSPDLCWSGASMDGNVATWEEAWGGLVFNMENRSYTDYKYVVIDFAEATAAKIKLEVYYAAEETAGSSVEMDAGATQIKLNLDAAKSADINKIALMSAKPATVTIAGAVLTDTYTANPVIWEGNTELVNMNTNFTVKADKLANVKLGDKLTVYFEVGTNTTYGTIQLCYGWTKLACDASRTNTKPDGNYAPGTTETSVVITEQADVDGLLKSGLRVKGKNVILKKIMLTGEGDDPEPPVVDPDPVNPDDPIEGTVVLWTGSTDTGNWANDVTVDAPKFSSVKAGDAIKLYLSVKAGAEYGNVEMNDQNYEKLPLDKTAAELDSYGCIQPDVTCLTYPVTDGDVALLKANGLRVKGVDVTITKIELVAGKGGDNPPVVDGEEVVWSGSVATGVWANDVTVDAPKFAKFKAGDFIIVNLKVDDGSEFGNIELDDQLYNKLATDGTGEGLDSYGCVQPEVTELKYVITNGDIDLLKANGLRVKGANITVEKITVRSGEALPPEEEPDNVETIWTGSVNCGQWKEEILVSADKFAAMNAGDKLSVDLSINAGKGKGFVEVSAQDGTVLEANGKGTNVDASGQLTNRSAKNVTYELGAGDVALLKANGLRIRGFAVTVTKVQLQLMKSGEDDGVDEIVGDEVPAEYYNLSGVRVENPANGIYIKRQGKKVSKVLLR